MSPLKIRILLHYYYSPEDWPENKRFDVDTLREFVKDGYLEVNPMPPAAPPVPYQKYGPTDKLRAHVEYLIAVPEPVAVTEWRVPDRGNS